jgi:hypothetical protein
VHGLPDICGAGAARYLPELRGGFLRRPVRPTVKLQQYPPSTKHIGKAARCLPGI